MTLRQDHTHSAGTYVQAEEYAYPNGAMRRKARALVTRNPHNPIDLPYGQIRAAVAGIPDTFFTIPARMKYRGKNVCGYLTVQHDSPEGALQFIPEADPERCVVCEPGQGCKRG